MPVRAGALVRPKDDANSIAEWKANLMPSANRKIHIVGIGDDGLMGLTQQAQETIAAADLILGGERTLSLIPATKANKISIGADLSSMVRRIDEASHQRVVVLASGDPLFYGVARYLCDRLGKDRFEVLPHVSSMQLAFARVKESWEDAYLTNVANHPFEAILDRIRVAETVGLFSNERFTPPVIAHALLDDEIDYFRVYVCENLGSRDEVITQGTLAEIAEMQFGPLNVMILSRIPDVPDSQRRAGARRLFGNPDELFLQSRPKRGLLTPAEVRSLALGQLSVDRDSVVWDVGAGSGAVSIEAGRLATEGAVYAIEADGEDCELIRRNAATFDVSNVRVTHGRAPDVFTRLPDPDCVFIGGAGHGTLGIVREAFGRLRSQGHMVIHVASLENVSAATATLKELAGHVGLLMVNIARGAHQLESIRFESINPSFLVFVSKE